MPGLRPILGLGRQPFPLSISTNSIQLRVRLKHWFGLEQYTFERFLHLVLMLGLPAMLILEWTLMPDVEHYYPVRIVLSGLAAAVYFGSFRFPFLQRDFTYINYVMIYLVYSHLIFLTYVNGFPFYHSCWLIALMLGASLFFRTRTQLLIFQASMFLLVVQASILSWKETLVDVPVFLVVYTFMNISAYAIQDYIFRQRDRLEEAANSLRRSNKSLEQFAYVVSHDLQEPLRTVSSYVQLLERRYAGSLDDGADEFIGFTVDATKRMQRMIQGLLELSRVGSENLDRGEVDLNSVLDDVFANLDAAMDESDAMVHCPRLPTVTADRNMMQQLFQNLIQNAIKYRHPDRAPEIHLDVVGHPDHWRFSIRDNGRGIAQQYLKRVFDIFNRVAQSSDGVDGRGIGLAICKHIVLNHGGEIGVESVEGEGTTFWFSIAR
jgi:signal transduction histidine kinase